MLQSIRDHLTGWFAIFLFVLIGLAFALWGIGNYSFTNAAAVAAVNGEQIPLEEIRRAYRTQLQQYQQFYDEVPAELQEQIRTQVIQGLVRDEVLAQHTREVGYRVGDSALVEAIRAIPAFSDQGEFSPDLFRTRLSLQGISPQYFEEQVRRQLTVNQLQQALSQTAFLTPAEFRHRVRLEREQRRAEWAQVSATELANQVEIEEQEIVAFYDENPEAFMRPESVDVEFIRIDLDDIAATIQPTEEQLRDYYQREVEAGRFVAPEERRARHILIAVDDETTDAQARQQANELLGRIEGGEDFAALATEFSDDPGSAPEGGDLGWAQRDAYVGPFADTLFSMQPGELAGPVRTDFGYHLIKLQQQRGGEARPFEELRDDLRAELARGEAENEFFDLSEAAADLSFENPDSLEPVATELGLPLQTQSGVSRASSDGIAEFPSVVAAAFSERVMEQGENSDLLRPDDETRIVLRVRQYHPAAVRPLTEVRDQIAVQLQQRRAQQMAAEKGADMLGRVREGQPLAGVAADIGASYNEPDEYRRTSGLPPALRSALFAAPKPVNGQPTISSVTLEDGSFVVFALSEVLPGDTAVMPDGESIAVQSGMGQLAAYITELTNQARVVTRPELLE